MFIGAFSELDYDARSLRASIGRACHARIVTRAVFIPLELRAQLVVLEMLPTAVDQRDAAANLVGLRPSKPSPGQELPRRPLQTW